MAFSDVMHACMHTTQRHAASRVVLVEPVIRIVPQATRLTSVKHFRVFYIIVYIVSYYKYIPYILDIFRWGKLRYGRIERKEQQHFPQQSCFSEISTKTAASTTKVFALSTNVFLSFNK